MKYVTTVNNTTFEVDIQPDGTVLVNGEKREVDFRALGPNLYSIIAGSLSYELVIEERENEHLDVLVGGRMYSARALDERAQLMAARAHSMLGESGEVTIKAPMPGLVVAVPVPEGGEVKAGDTVVVLESMKMQNELKAPHDGIVLKVHVSAGQSVEQNKSLVVIA